MDLNILEQGLTVLCLGFTIVFAFLCIMIFAMGIMRRVVEYINKICPPQVQAVAVAKKASSNEDEEVAVAIAAVLAR